MTNEELLSVAEIVERATNRFNAQAVNFQERCNKYEKLMADMKAEHEAKMFEHRAAFGARTKADAETIDRLHTERDALRAEVADLKTQLERLTSWAAKNQAARETLQTEMERLRSENQIMRNDAEDGYAEAIKVLGDPIALSKERDALRAEVAALKSQTSKPCDQPVTVKREPEVGDTVQLVKRPTKQDYELSWLDDWGKVGESFRAVSGVCTYNKTPSVLVEIRGKNYSWPLSCVEVVTEATHDTEAGKAAAAAAVKTEPVADEIKVGDVVEVFQSTASCTFKTDIGTRGTVLQLDDSCVDTAPLDGFLAPKYNHVALCDVRKVTT